MGTCRRVLIVDDDPILRVIVHSYFDNLGGFEIFQAADGRGALEIVEHRGHEIDFIMCDLNMPELDGIQFLRQLKDHVFSGAICILSGEDQLVVETAQKLAHLHSLRIVGALQKPLNVGDLDQLIPRISESDAKEKSRPFFSVSESALRNAIDKGQIEPFYQPKVEVSSRKIVGVEALARWTHPQFGMIAPGDFIPVAEQSGLIGNLTSAVLTRAMDDAKRLQACGIFIKTAINIAADLLHNLDFPDRISAEIEAAGLNPPDFVLEVTESGILQKTSDPMEVLTRLRIKGFGLSIDDFGTGHSNVDQLRNFPFSELKIDRSFIQGATKDSISKAIVDAAVLLGRELNMRLVAEGVETQSDWNFVAENGIDEIQGFLVAKPMPAMEFMRWHNEHGGSFTFSEQSAAKRDQRQAAHV